MIHQRLWGLISHIRDTGCYFILIVNMWCRAAGVKISVKIINKTYKEAVKRGYIRKSCYMNYGAARGISNILNLYLLPLRPITVTYVGRFTNGHFDYDDSSKTVFTNLVGRHHRPKEEYSHFKEVCHNGDPLVDTWPELGFTKKDLIDSRLFNVEES